MTAARRITLNVPMRFTWIVRENEARSYGPSLPTTRPTPMMPGEIDRHVHAAESCFGHGQGSLHAGFVGDVGAGEAGTLAQLSASAVPACSCTSAISTLPTGAWRNAARRPRPNRIRRR